MNRRRRAPNRLSGANTTRMAQSGNKWQLFGGLLCHLARPGGDPERGFFGGWAALRALERKTFICGALCRLVPSVTRQPRALNRGCRIAPFDHDNHALKARPSAGEGPNHPIRDITSICQRLFILITSPRRGERSAAGRVRGDRRSAQQNLRRTGRADRCGQSWL